MSFLNSSTLRLASTAACSTVMIDLRTRLRSNSLRVLVCALFIFSSMVTYCTSHLLSVRISLLLCHLQNESELFAGFGEFLQNNSCVLLFSAMSFLNSSTLRLASTAACSTVMIDSRTSLRSNSLRVLVCSAARALFIFSSMVTYCTSHLLSVRISLLLCHPICISVYTAHCRAPDSRVRRSHRRTAYSSSTTMMSFG